MKTKANPIITQTEILNRAIRSIEAEIDDWRKKCEILPEDQKDVMFTASTNELSMKLTALRTMYLFETGTEYV